MAERTPEDIGRGVVQRLRAEGNLTPDTIIAAVACSVPMMRLGDWTAPAVRAAFAEAGYVVAGPGDIEVLDGLMEALGDPTWIHVAAQECEGPAYITPWLRRVGNAVDLIRRRSA